MYEVGSWVRSKDGHLVGEIVQADSRGCGEETTYLVRTPKVVIETSNGHAVAGADLKPARVEDSHLAMAIDHLEYVCDELISAGRVEEAEAIWALLKKLDK